MFDFFIHFFKKVVCSTLLFKNFDTHDSGVELLDQTIQKNYCYFHAKLYNLFASELDKVSNDGAIEKAADNCFYGPAGINRKFWAFRQGSDDA